MKSSIVEKIVLRTDANIRSAISAIDQGSIGIALVLDDDEKLLATITDGDIRRVILSGVTLDESITKIIEYQSTTQYPKPISADVDMGNDELLKIMHDRQIHQIPLHNTDNQIVDLKTIDMLIPDNLLGLTAVVMAGGQGVRLRPLTLDTPKPMLDVGGKPLLEHIVAQLKKDNVDDITITTHYLPEKIQSHFGDGTDYGVDIKYLFEHEPLGTAGALSKLEDLDKTVLLINGDVLTNLDFSLMRQFHNENKSAITMAVRQYDVNVPYGVVECEGTSVTRVIEKPSYPFFVNAGIYLIEPRVVKLIPQDKRFDITDLFEILKEREEEISAFPIFEYWLDIGKLSDYERAHLDMTNGEIL